MRLRIHVRIHPQRNGRAQTHVMRDFRQPAQFGFGLDVEALDLGGQRGAHFPGLLAHTGKHDPGRVRTGRQGALELAAGNDVEARAQAREFLQDGQVGIGLHAVADQHRMLADGIAVGFPGSLERGARVNVQRRAQLFGQVIQRHVLGVQDIVAELEVRMTGQFRLRGESGGHGMDCTGGMAVGCGCGCVREGGLPSGVGMYKGPLYPQAATMPVASSVATMRRTMRRNAKWNTGNS